MAKTKKRFPGIKPIPIWRIDIYTAKNRPMKKVKTVLSTEELSEYLSNNIDCRFRQTITIVPGLRYDMGEGNIPRYVVEI